MTRVEKVAVWGSTLATTVTGVGFFWTKYLVESDQPWAVINHPLQPWLLKAHILVAPLLVFAVGMITLRHIWRHVQSRTDWGRRTGLFAMATVAPMIITGYLIQAVTHPIWLQGTAILHIVTGTAFALAVALHLPSLRKDRRRAVPGTGNAPVEARAPKRERRARPAAGLPHR